MRAILRLALVSAVAFALPITSADAASFARPKLEWRTRSMNIDLPAERGACTEREFEVDAAGRATLSWAPDGRGHHQVEVTVVHRRTGQVVFGRTLCEAGSFGFQVDDCLLERGKHFDVHVRQVGRRPCAVSGKLCVQRLMRKG